MNTYSCLLELKDSDTLLPMEKRLKLPEDKQIGTGMYENEKTKDDVGERTRSGLVIEIDTAGSRDHVTNHVP